MSKVQIVFPPGQSQIFSWTVGAVLEETSEFRGLRWDEPVDPEAALVIFLADSASPLDLTRLRRAAYLGPEIFVVTGERGTVGPKDVGGHEATMVTFFHISVEAGEGFRPFHELSEAIHRVLDQSSDD